MTVVVPEKVPVGSSPPPPLCLRCDGSRILGFSHIPGGKRKRVDPAPVRNSRARGASKTVRKKISNSHDSPIPSFSRLHAKNTFFGLFFPVRSYSRTTCSLSTVTTTAAAAADVVYDTSSVGRPAMVRAQKTTTTPRQVNYTTTTA